MQIEKLLPEEIEQRSFEIIASELPHAIDPELAPIILRAIHTSADFEYADSLKFSPNAMQEGLAALKSGVTIITDTTMAKSGINKTALAKLGCEVQCFIGDPDVVVAAKEHGTTRAEASIDKAAKLPGAKIFAIGNAPTALLRINDLIKDGLITPSLVIGVPVGFVNVIQSKEIIMKSGVPYIVAEGRKGGSNIAAAIVNALMYKLVREPILESKK